MTTSIEAILNHAEKLASDLELDMAWQAPEAGFGGGYWKATNPRAAVTIRARANRAIAFLQGQAGENSHWTTSARLVLQSNGENQSMESGARGVGETVRLWIDEVRQGFASPRLADDASTRRLASSDLMEQVRILVADRTIHPAAPIVLAGAALEMSLRAAAEALELDPPEKPSLQSYAGILRDANVLTKQDVKDVTQIGGVRNAAAHGSFDEISRERAALMEQQVNLLLAQLPERLEAAVRH